MKDEKIIALMGAFGDPNPVVADSWIRSSCPMAWARHKSGKDANPSFGITRQTDGQPSVAHCFGCGFRGTLEHLYGQIIYERQFKDMPAKINLAKALEIISTEEDDLEYVPLPDFEQLDENQKVVVTWPEAWLDTFPSALKSPRAMKYLTGRGIPEDTIKLQNLKYDFKRDMIGFPFRTADGTLAGMRGRAISPEAPLQFYDYTWQGHNNSELLWYGEDSCDFQSTIVVVEGQSDWGAVKPVYPNVLAGLTASLTKARLKKLLYAERVVGFYDNDDAGKQASEKTREFLGKHSVPYVAVDYERLSSVHGHSDYCKDPDRVPREILPSFLSYYLHVGDALPAWDDLAPF